MEPNSRKPDCPAAADTLATAASGTPVLSNPVKSDMPPLPPPLSPADQRLCDVGGRLVAWFIAALGLATALGSAVLVYLAVRWLWLGGMARWLRE